MLPLLLVSMRFSVVVMTVAVTAVGGWVWPIAAPHPIVRPYAAPATPYSAGHRGIDLGAAVGAPVLAPADGVVHFAGVVVDRPVLSIELPGDVLVSVEPVTSTLRAGEVVHRGQVVGVLVAGDHCGGDPCLHLGVRIHGDYVSPLLFLGGVPRAILYPMSGPGPPNPSASGRFLQRFGRFTAGSDRSGADQARGCAVV